MRGYIQNDEVRAPQCLNCKQTTQPLTVNYGNPDLYLYGCKDTKCQHRLLRFDFNNRTLKGAAAKS